RLPDGRFDDRRTAELMRPRQAARAACRMAARRYHMWKWTAILPALVVLAGCAHEYTYQPTEHATGSIGGHVAADYEIPPAAPQGVVRLASFGLAELRPANGSGDGRPALHLRMVVSNNDAQPWTIDTREQKLDVQSTGSIPPAFS